MSKGRTANTKVRTARARNAPPGTGADGYSGDGGLATAVKVGHPQQIRTDRHGNVYILQADKNVVRKIDIDDGKNLFSTRLTGNTIPSPSAPPTKQMPAASRRN